MRYKYWIPVPPDRFAYSPNLYMGAELRALGIDVSTDSEPPTDVSERVYIHRHNLTKLPPVPKCRFKVYIAGMMSESVLVSYDRYAVKAFLNEFDLIVCPTHFCKHNLLFQDIRVDTIVVPHGIPSHFEPRTITKSYPERFLMIASSCERKGVYLAAQLFEQWRKVPLTILSRAGDHELLRARVSNYEYVNLVTEPILNTDLPRFINLFDAYISLSYYETFNVALYEVLRTQTPCIASRIPAHVEWLDETMCYMSELSDEFYFNANDVGHMMCRVPLESRALAILDHCYSHYNLGLVQARNGSKMVQEKMNWGNWLQQVEQYIDYGT